MHERVRAGVDAAALAVAFLTRLPVPWPLPGDRDALARSTPWFPVVGLGIGACGALAWWLAAALWGPALAALAAVAATVVATGALHEDGVADTFDGLGSGGERERALAIMKDSQLGAYGALALGLVLAARVLALVALGPAAPAALVGAHGLARYASLPLLRWLPYARVDGGTGQPFAGGASAAGLLTVTLLTLVVTAALWGTAALAAWLACAGVVALFAAWCRRRLGGITGDTLGAAIVLAELAIYLALAADAVPALGRPL